MKLGEATSRESGLAQHAQVASTKGGSLLVTFENYMAYNREKQMKLQLIVNIG